MFEASAVIKLKISFERRCLDCYNKFFFLAVLGIYFIRQKFSYISLIYKKIPFTRELILMKNINKPPKKIENVKDDGNK